MANSSVNSSKNGSVDRHGRKPTTKIPISFFSRSTLLVAPDLLGKVLCVQAKEGLVTGRIVETEAYLADDPASHSYKGPTPRSSIMFGPPGRVYVYFIYGMYEMLNFVTEPDGQAGAVLIRAIEPISGEELMRKRRSPPKGKATGKTAGKSTEKVAGKSSKKRILSLHDLTGGPGKLCRAFGIELSDNGEKVGGSRIWLEDDGIETEKVLISPRIGISKGQDRLWRFFLDKNEFVSSSPMNARASNYKK
jgi:DNA-3-methyladenine glycosylase